MSSHSPTQLFVHLVWTTKYRLPTIAPHDDVRLCALLGEAATSAESELVAAGNAEDHVHALVRISAKVSVAALAQRLKGRTSYFGGWAWQRGYYAESVSLPDVAAKASYVRDQRHHHPQIEPELAEGELEDGAKYLLPPTSSRGSQEKGQ